MLLAAAIIPPIFGWLPLALSALASALLMVLTGCVTPRGARRSVDWRVLFMIIGTIPLGAALDETGVASRAADAIISLEASLGTPGVLMSLFALTMILSVTCNNGAAAVIMAPVAAACAVVPGLDVGKAFLAVAYGASCAFLLPFGNQCNLMVMGPGGYEPKDYLRAGAGLTVLVACASVLLLWLIA